MKRSYKVLTKIAMASVSFLILQSCVADPDSSGLEYMPDMYRSPAIEPYVDYAEVKGKENLDRKMQLSAKVPPFGTIPYYGNDTAMVKYMMPYNQLPYMAFKSTHGLVNMNYSMTDNYESLKTSNSLMLTSDNSEMIFDSGKKLYASMCAHCHGEKGDGQGPMVLSGAYTGVPDYKTKMDLSDGQIFYTIYYGKGMMGAHGSLLNKKEIWTLVHHVRKLQNGDYGNVGADGKITGMMAPVATDSLP